MQTSIKFKLYKYIVIVSLTSSVARGMVGSLPEPNPIGCYWRRILYLGYSYWDWCCLRAACQWTSFACCPDCYCWTTRSSCRSWYRGRAKICYSASLREILSCFDFCRCSPSCQIFFAKLSCGSSMRRDFGWARTGHRKTHSSGWTAVSVSSGNCLAG